MAEILARDNQLLFEHVSNVNEYIHTFIPRKTAPEGTQFTDLATVTALTHDIAKATPQFQNYIINDESDSPHPHAPVSAIIGFDAAIQRGINEKDALFVLYSIYRHHSSLGISNTSFNHSNMYEHIKHTFCRDGEVLDQIQEKNPNGDINTHSGVLLDAIISNIHCFDIASEIYKKASDGDDITQCVNRIKNGTIKNQIINAIKNDTPTIVGFDIDCEYITNNDMYEPLLRIWSALILADILDSSGLNPSYIKTDENHNGVNDIENYINELQNKTVKSQRERQMNTIRNEAYTEINGNENKNGTIQQFIESNNNIATITLPTGVGKTITGLAAAQQIVEKDNSKNNVIYSLPYTSIIDQTAETITDIYDAEITDPEITVHHHLSKTTTQHDDITSNQADIIGTTWHSNVIITTFVQLFESLIAPTKKQGLKIPNIDNSVIIIDEPQAITEIKWALIKHIISFLTNKFNVNIILMTATQPNILPENKTMNLIQKPERYFENDILQRVKYNIHESVPQKGDTSNNQISTTNASETIVNDVLTNNHNTMAICNTISSTRLLYNSIKDTISETSKQAISVNKICEQLSTQYESITHDGSLPSPSPKEIQNYIPDESIPYIQITSRHRPIDRLSLIKFIQSYPSDKPLLIVTTPIVEAGVDISVSSIYRDFAPLPNIIQSAGRCNRNNKQKYGTVTVWQIEGDKQPPSKIIHGYGINTLADTSKVLQSCNINLQNEHTLINKYYQYLSKRNVDTPDIIDQCNLKKMNGKQLIEKNEIRNISLIVSHSTVEHKYVTKLKRAYKQYNFNKVEQIEQVLNPCIINVPIYQIEQTPLEKIAETISEYSSLIHLNTKYNRNYNFENGVTNKQYLSDRFL